MWKRQRLLGCSVHRAGHVEGSVAKQSAPSQAAVVPERSPEPYCGRTRAVTGGFAKSSSQHNLLESHGHHWHPTAVAPGRVTR